VNARAGTNAAEPGLQATVKDYDAVSGSGTVLLDDGHELAFPAGALRPPARLLRSGQRVRLRVQDGAVLALTLSAFPLGP